MYTYKQYLDYCKKINRQPLNETAYNSLIAIKFCPIRSEYIK